MGLGPTTTTVLVAAGVGLVAGAVAERLLSPDSISKSEAGGAWGKLHEGFLEDHPVPSGTNVFVTSQPAWQNAAAVIGGGAAVGALGGGLAFASSKMQPQNAALRMGGIAAAVLGASVVAGAGASWALRGAFD